jgi:hypothetical protein
MAPPRSLRRPNAIRRGRRISRKHPRRTGIVTRSRGEAVGQARPALS